MAVAPRPQKLNVPGTGLGQIYLAKVKATAIMPHADRKPEEDGPAPVYGTLQEFTEKFADDQVAMDRLRNKVKVCKNCGKPCAYTLTECNSCGASLYGIDISHSDNVFMCFTFGIGAGRFPLKISLRKQSKDFLCFDDMLSMSVCHLNVIPTSVYCPDLRYLFTDPARGLALINNLYDFGATAAMDLFWSDAEFRRKYWNDEKPPASPMDLYPMALCGMNFPPSQFQLHLQFIHAPMLPFHFAQARMENHFHYRRFFPLEYLRRALALGERVKMSVNDDTDIEDIITKVEELGVNYDEVQVSLLRRCRRMQERFSPWQEEDFEDYVIGNRVLDIETLAVKPDDDPKKIQVGDTSALQNYGRPYTQEGKPTGTYYRYPKLPSEVVAFAQG